MFEVGLSFFFQIGRKLIDCYRNSCVLLRYLIQLIIERNKTKGVACQLRWKQYEKRLNLNFKLSLRYMCNCTSRHCKIWKVYIYVIDWLWRHYFEIKWCSKKQKKIWKVGNQWTPHGFEFWIFHFSKSLRADTRSAVLIVQMSHLMKMVTVLIENWEKNDMAVMFLSQRNLFSPFHVSLS